MKRKRMIVACMILLATVACSRTKEAPRPEQAAPKADARPLPPPETPEEKQKREAKEQEENKLRHEEFKLLQAQTRATELRTIRENFLPNKYPIPEGGPEHGWRAKLYGQQLPPFDSACADYMQFYELHYSFLKVGESDYAGNGKLTWEEVGMPEKQAVAHHRAEGLKVARDFIDIFKVSLQDRVLAKKCSTGGEGAGFRFTETNEVSRIVDELLEQVGGEPKDIGLTPESWRAIALADFRQRIERLRGGKEEGHRLVIAYEAAERWHFKPVDVGLTPDEMKQYEAQYGHSNR